MATLVDWPLPLSPPYQGNQSQNSLTHLTPAREGRLYYTKSFIEVVGELDTQGAVARTQLVSLTRPVVPAPDKCYLHFPLGAPFASSYDISLSLGAAVPPTIYFTEPVLNTIGELHP